MTQLSQKLPHKITPSVHNSPPQQPPVFNFYFSPGLAGTPQPATSSLSPLVTTSPQAYAAASPSITAEPSTSFNPPPARNVISSTESSTPVVRTRTGRTINRPKRYDSSDYDTRSHRSRSTETRKSRRGGDDGSADV